MREFTKYKVESLIAVETTRPVRRLRILNEVMATLKEAYLNDEFDIDDYFRYSRDVLEEIKQLDTKGFFSTELAELETN